MPATRSARPARPAALATRVIVAAALVALVGAGSALPAQTPDDARDCDRALSPARWPDARGRVEAAARGAGAAGDFARGCLAMADGRWNDAAKAFERAVGANERNAVHHFWLGRAYGEVASNANVLRQPGLARRVKGAFVRAVELDPDYLDAREGLMQFHLLAPAIAGGSVDRAREQVAEIRRRDAYRGGLLAGRLAARQRDAAGAAREYEALVAQHPDSVAPHSALVALHAGQRQWDAAFRAVDRWLSAQPGAKAAHYAAGRTAAESGRELDRGERSLRRYLAGATPAPNEPSFAAAHWRLGGIHERRGDRDAARAAYGQALALDPAFRQAREALARLR